MHIHSTQLDFFSSRGIKLPGALPLPESHNALGAQAVQAVSPEEGLPRERGDSARQLLAEYRDKEAFAVDYDAPEQSRNAISQYLLNQHAQRRDEIRAMVGVDLYA